MCLGNICRSPTAAGVMRHVAQEAGLSGGLQIESAGTSDWHVGEMPDRRAWAEARRRGVELEDTARQFTARDFARFDRVLAMDASNLAALREIAPDAKARGKIHLLREFAPGGEDAPLADLDVPDPYFGGERGFEDVFDLIEAACEGLLERLRGPLEGGSPPLPIT